MAQQTSKYLLKQVQSGKLDLNKFEFDISQNLDLDQQALVLYEMRFKNELYHAGLELQTKKGSFNEKWNNLTLVSLVNCTVYFCEYWALRNFYGLIKGEQELYDSAANKPMGKLTQMSGKL